MKRLCLKLFFLLLIIIGIILLNFKLLTERKYFPRNNQIIEYENIKNDSN